MRLCIDVDNVLAETDSAMRALINEYTKGRVNLRQQDITEFDYCRCKDANGNAISDAEWREIHDLFSEHDHVIRLRPIEGCREALRTLADSFTVHIATSRLRKAWPATIGWLTDHGINPHALHFVAHREKHLVLTNVHAVVEDDYEQAVLFAEKGVPCYLLRRPWNLGRPSVPNIAWARSWSELLKLLLASAQVQEHMT